MNERIRVLVVDDDPMYLDLVERNLPTVAFEVTRSDTTLGVSNLIRKVRPAVVLLDVNVPALSGDSVLSLARRHAPSSTKFVLFSSSDEATLRRLAKQCGADAYFSKSKIGPQLADMLEAIVNSFEPPSYSGVR